MKLFTKITIGLLCVGLCVGILVFHSVQKNELKYDDREFQELLKENELLYEQNLRVSHKIPSGIGVKEYLGESYRDEMQKENEKYIARRKAIQILAEQYCDIEPLDYDGLLKLMEDENDSRAQRIAKGEVIYGVQKFDFSQFSTYYWDELENTVINEFVNTMKIDRAELEEYYREMEEPLYTEGEKISYYLYMSEEEPFDVTNLQNCERKKIELDFEEVRQYIREYGVEENVLLNFDKEQTHYLYDENGKNVYIQFEKIQKDSELSEEDLGMLRSRIAREKYEEEIDAILEKWDL